MEENKELSKLFWGLHVWARGYFVARSGNITDEVILEQIKNQDDNEGSNEEFTIVDWLQSTLVEIKPFGLQPKEVQFYLFHT